MTEVGSAQASLELQTAQFTRALNEATRDLRRFHSAVKNVQPDIAGTGRAMNSTGAQAVAMGNVMADVARKIGELLVRALKEAIRYSREAVNAFAEFDAKAREAVASLDNQSVALAKVSDSATKLAIEWGVAAEKVVGGQGEMIKAGYGLEASQQAVGEALKFSIANTADFDASVKTATTTQKVFAKEADDLSGIFDKITVAVDASTANFDEFLESFKYIGPEFEQAGTNVAEMSSMLAVLADSSVEGSRAGRALRSAMNSIINPTVTAEEAFRDMGVEVKNQAGEVRALEDVIGDMAAANVTATQVNKAFGDQAGQAINILIQNRKAYEDLTVATLNSTGAVANKAAFLKGSFKSAMDTAKERIDATKRSIGEALTPAVNVALQVWANFTGRLQDNASMQSSMHQAIAATVRALAGLLDFLVDVIDMMSIFNSAIAAVAAMMRVAVRSIRVFMKYALMTQKIATLDFSGAKQQFQEMRALADENPLQMFERTFKSVNSGLNKFTKEAKRIRADAVPALNSAADSIEAMGVAKNATSAIREVGEASSESQEYVKEFSDSLSEVHRKDFGNFADKFAAEFGTSFENLPNEAKAQAVEAFTREMTAAGEATKTAGQAAKQAAAGYRSYIEQQEAAKRVEMERAGAIKEQQNAQTASAEASNKAETQIKKLTKAQEEHYQSVEETSKAIRDVDAILADRTLSQDKQVELETWRDRLSIKKEELQLEKQLREARSQDDADPEAIRALEARKEVLEHEKSLLPEILEARKREKDLTQKQARELVKQQQYKERIRQIDLELRKAGDDAVAKERLRQEREVLKLKQQELKVRQELKHADASDDTGALQAELQRIQRTKQELGEVHQIELERIKAAEAATAARAAEKAQQAEKNKLTAKEIRSLQDVHSLEMKILDIKHQQEMLDEGAHIQNAQLQALADEAELRRQILEARNSLINEDDPERIRQTQNEIAKLRKQLEHLRQASQQSIGDAFLKEMEEGAKRLQEELKKLKEGLHDIRMEHAGQIGLEAGATKEFGREIEFQMQMSGKTPELMDQLYANQLQTAELEKQKALMEVKAKLANESLSAWEAQLERQRIEQRFMHTTNQAIRERLAYTKQITEEQKKQQFERDMGAHLSEISLQAKETQLALAETQAAMSEGLSKQLISEQTILERKQARLAKSQQLAALERELANDKDGLISKAEEINRRKEIEVGFAMELHDIERKRLQLEKQRARQAFEKGQDADAEGIALMMRGGISKEAITRQRTMMELERIRFEQQQGNLNALEAEEKIKEAIQRRTEELVAIERERYDILKGIGSILGSIGDATIAVTGDKGGLGGLLKDLGGVVDQTAGVAANLGEAMVRIRESGANGGFFAGGGFQGLVQGIGGLANTVVGITQSAKQGGIMGAAGGAIQGAGAGAAIGSMFGPVGGIVGGLVGGIGGLLGGIFGGGDYDIGEEGLRNLIERAQTISQAAAEMGMDSVQRNMTVLARRMSERGPGMDKDEVRANQQRMIHAARRVEAEKERIQAEIEAMGRSFANSLSSYRKELGGLVTDDMEDYISDIQAQLTSGNITESEDARRIIREAKKRIISEIANMVSGVANAITGIGQFADDVALQVQGMVQQARASSEGWIDYAGVENTAENTQKLYDRAWRVMVTSMRKQLKRLQEARSEGIIDDRQFDAFWGGLHDANILARHDKQGAAQLFNQILGAINNTLPDEEEAEQTISDVVEGKNDISPEEQARIWADEFFKRVRRADRQVIINLDAKGALMGDAQARRQLIKYLRDAVRDEIGGTGVF